MAAFLQFLTFFKWKMNGKWQMENGVIVKRGARPERSEKEKSTS